MSVEVGWFSALCDDDYRYLGVHDPALKSSWPHCSSITLAADRRESRRRDAALEAILADMRRRAAVLDRSLRFGYRVHVIVRAAAAACSFSPDTPTRR